MSIIDDYFKTISEPQKLALARVRKIVQQAVPDAEEVISYGMPGYRYKNKYLITFRQFQDHMSIFPGAAAVEAVKDRLTSYKYSKGTIQFTVENPIPEILLLEIIKNRKAEININRT